jgi:hypothetical protein
MMLRSDLTVMYCCLKFVVSLLVCYGILRSKVEALPTFSSALR